MRSRFAMALYAREVSEMKCRDRGARRLE